MDSLQSVLSTSAAGTAAQDDSDQSLDEGGGSELETYKARIAGYTRAVNRLKEEHGQALARSLDERDQALSRLAEIETENAALRGQTAAWWQEVVSAKYPNVHQALGEQAASLDPGMLDALETRYGQLARSAAVEADDDYSPPVNPNNPRRVITQPKAVDEKSYDELKADLARMGNPYTPKVGWER